MGVEIFPDVLSGKIQPEPLDPVTLATQHHGAGVMVYALLTITLDNPFFCRTCTKPKLLDNSKPGLAIISRVLYNITNNSMNGHEKRTGHLAKGDKS